MVVFIVLEMGCIRALHRRLEGERAVCTGEYESMACDMVLRSVGYVGTRYDESLPYTPHAATIQNTGSRVTESPGE